ncbi:MAG: hypothetical protein ACRDRK_26335, partial [Pseudonocardia sp.]
LALPQVPVLVVQGERDPFGRPDAAPGREVVVLRGDHSLKADRAALVAAVAGWLLSREWTAPSHPRTVSQLWS